MFKWLFKKIKQKRCNHEFYYSTSSCGELWSHYDIWCSKCSLMFNGTPMLYDYIEKKYNKKIIKFKE